MTPSLFGLPSSTLFMCFNFLNLFFNCIFEYVCVINGEHFANKGDLLSLS